MSYLYIDLQNEVKRRSVRNQSGTQFDTAIQNIINTSLFRLAREAPWKQLRRKTTIATEGNYTTGTVAATKDSKNLTFTTSTLITQGINIGQRIQIQGSAQRYIIDQITSNTAAVVNLAYDGTTASGLTFTIFGKEEYNLPIQTYQVAMVWHEDFNYPYLLQYIPDKDFYETGIVLEIGNTPTHYRAWGVNTVIDQPLTPGILAVSSSSSSDTTQAVVIFGNVSSYPDFESVNLNGTTTVNTTKTFQNVERVVKSASTTGRVTVTADSANTTVAVLPVGTTAGSVQYKKFQVWPLPKRVFNFNVEYYKEPFRLVNSNDIHELGQEFDEAIILLSVAKIKAENSQTEADFWMKMYKDELNNLKKLNADNLDWIPTLKRPWQTRHRRGLFTNGLLYQQVGGLYGPSSYRI